MQERGEGVEGKSEMRRAKEEEGMACSPPQISNNGMPPPSISGVKDGLRASYWRELAVHL